MPARVLTAAELEQMTPAERRAAFNDSIVTELADAPTELLERTRDRIEQRIDAETSQSG